MDPTAKGLVVLGSQVAALELVVATLLGLLLATQAQSAGDNETVEQLADRMQAQLKERALQGLARLPDGLMPPALGQLVTQTMAETVERCFTESANHAVEVARAVMEAVEARSGRSEPQP